MHTSMSFLVHKMTLTFAIIINVSIWEVEDTVFICKDKYALEFHVLMPMDY